MDQNIDLYRERQDQLLSYTTEITSYLIALESNEENQKNTNRNIQLTILAVITSVWIFFMEQILKRYGVTHIYLNFLTAGKDIEPILKEMGLPVVARGNSFCLFSVSPNNLQPQTR